MPEEFVDQFYVMDPEKERVLAHSGLLENGMIVLFESWELRQSLGYLDVDDETRPMYHQIIRERNRWCKVTELTVVGPSGQLRFIGVYEDGTSIVRTFNYWTAWLVKNDPEV